MHYITGQRKYIYMAITTYISIYLTVGNKACTAAQEITSGNKVN